jgi:biopolymer transport protein TolR
MNTSGFGRLTPTRSAKPMSEINVTPLVDVMLVLVVIFILTAPLLATSIRLDLPKTDAGTESSGSASSVSLVIDRAGQAYLDDRALPLVELQQSLQRAAAQNPDTEVQLRADENAPYGKVIEVLGAAQQAGLGRIGFVTDAPAVRVPAVAKPPAPMGSTAPTAPGPRPARDFR